MAIARMIPLLLALMVIVAPATEAALTCSRVTDSILPCLTYLTGGALSASCCSGVKSLAAAASTTADRQAACRCLKSAASGVSGINPDNAAGLLGKCGVRIPYKISPSADCDSVK